MHTLKLSLLLHCSIFTNNTSNTLGGAVNAGNRDEPSSLVNITVSSFSNNQASDNGGALYLSGSAYLQDTILSNNRAQGSGGAVDASQATLTVSGTVFSSNNAIANGGAINSSQRALIVSDTLYTANTAEGSGGAVYHFGSADFNKCIFTENLSLGYGGAICAQRGSSLLVADSSLSNNSASFAGGAIFTFAPRNEFVVANTVVFNYNTASCCYANNEGISVNTSCTNVDGSSGTGANECCLAKYYSDGEHCQLCTAELACDSIVGANTSTVVLPRKLWRARTTSLKTYSCWNSDHGFHRVRPPTEANCTAQCYGARHHQARPKAFDHGHGKG
jgi:predicted outer membrane repeat protein